MKQCLQRVQDEKLLFVDKGLSALEKIGWYGFTTFTCPLCGGKAEAKRIKVMNSVRNKATWLYCGQCGMYVHDNSAPAEADTGVYKV